MTGMRVVILAGGKGSRLGAVCDSIPKPMVHVGGRPLLEHQVLLCRRYGFRDIIIITGYRAEYIESYFRDGSSWDVSIKYYREQTPLGTTGGIKELEAGLDRDFMVLYGDVMMDLDLRRLVDFHLSRRSDCTLVVHPNDHPYDSDLVEIDSSGRITAFYSKPHSPELVYRNLVSAALYVMSPRILQYIRKGVKADFGRDVFPAVIGELNMFGYSTPEYIKDVGTPQRLAEVERDWRSGRIARMNRANRRRAVFIDRDGVINREVGLLHDANDFELLPDVPEALRMLNVSEFLAIVVTNQPVVARNLCSIDQLEYIHKKMETLLGERHAMLDAVYYCPHHPDRGYPEENVLYKIACTCRKPGTGMIEQAVKDFGIDTAGSFLIGDSERDILCGNKAGITTIGVRTGYGCRDCRCEPDYFFEDLAEAVGFIVDDPYRDLFEELSSRYTEKSDKKPYVIAIGGNSRSGKSVCSRFLAGEFRKTGAAVLLVELDNWLLPLHERQSCADVFDRFQYTSIHADMQRLFDGDTVTLAKYDPKTRARSGENLSYRLDDADIVIVDGIVALSSAELRALADCKLFCDIEERLHKERVRRYYSWKGLGQAEINDVFKSRQQDEYPVINQDIRYADIVIESGKALQ